MEKLSVNGKTFDEIFEQRGEISSFEKIEPNRTYFSTPSASRFGAIFKRNGKGNRCTMLVNPPFVSDVAFFEESVFDGCKIYEATPDQIALLNLYKNL